MTVVVRAAVTLADLDQVRDLMRAFVAWHRARHAEDLHLIEQYFDPGEFEAELASLPGAYGPPGGALLLATADGAPLGCVALRGLQDGACEMKRMFVPAHAHGRGIGTALGQAVVEEGRRLGYRTMRLDTSIRQDEARRLYRRLGFVDTAPYYDLPESLRAWLVFMERPL